jgi:hypothetical protein
VASFVLFSRGERDLFLVDDLDLFVCHRCRFRFMISSAPSWVDRM